jgi:hypothetical protein
VVKEIGGIQLEWGQEIEREDQIGKSLLVFGIPGRVFYNRK